METNNFIIKPLRTDFDIREMRQLIAQWRVAGVTDSQIIKMQLLYYGEPAWMNLDKMYDCTRFNEMAKGMKFRNVSDFVEVIWKCKGFGRICKNQQDGRTPKNLMAFYSPLWHEEKKEDMDDGDDDELHEGDATPQEGNPEMQSRSPYIHTEDIYNKKKNIQKKNDSMIKGSDNAANGYAAPTPKAAAERERMVDLAARELLSSIALNDDAYTQIVKPINDKTTQLMPELFCDTKEPHPTNLATQRFFNNYVYPYLMEHGDKMLKIPSLQGRRIWLRRLIHFEFMQQNIQRAINDTRQYLSLHAEEMRRQNRPISPHEYQDQKTGLRFYDRYDEKGLIAQAVAIPAQAEPRPSAEAIWDKFAGKWKSSTTSGRNL